MKKQNNMEIGKEIARLRKEKGLTIRELAEKTGVVFSAFPNIESGKTDIRIGTLERIANGLGVRVSDIIERAEKSAKNLAEKG